MEINWMKKIMMMLGVILLTPSFSFAASPELLKLYETRGDLQAAFDSETLQAIPGSGAGFLIDLEDWARQYGWSEYPELATYAPVVTPARQIGATSAPMVTADNYIVIDDTTGTILAAEHADVSWPIASMTKLMTAKVAFDHGLDVYNLGEVLDEDDVGGGKLYVEDGTTFQIIDLVRAMIVASANNAANAVARLATTSGSFVDDMNEAASAMNLGRTHFADPTGIETGNISTAREMAYLAHQAFQNENIRRLAGTSAIHIEALNDPEYVRDIDSTNWLLYDPAYDDIYVTAGKTGFINESGWNVVVRMHPMGESPDKSVLIVVMGSDSRRESFDDAANLARWAWGNFDWDR